MFSNADAVRLAAAFIALDAVAGVEQAAGYPLEVL